MTREEYERRINDNQKISGYGFEVKCHVPCPFCGAADWLVHKILLTEEAYTQGAVCRECGRGAKAVFKHEGVGVQFEFFQTQGDDPPDFLPRMRRIEELEKPHVTH